LIYFLNLHFLEETVRTS